MPQSIQQQSVIVLDEDAETLTAVSRLLGQLFRVLATAETHKAIRWLESDQTVKVVIVNQNLRRSSGLELLEQVRGIRPDVRRILITQYDDLQSVVKGLHTDAIHRTISKPVQRTELAAALTAMNCLAEFAQPK
jgi:response regulator RpfG family c-di-GMP phosphodiesterase